MSAIVKFFDQSGHELKTRSFQTGQRIDINVVGTGIVGIPEPFSLVRVDILAGNRSIFSQQKTANLWGVADFVLQLPNEATTATVHAYVEYSIHGTDSVDIPIGIGKEVSQLPEPKSNGIPAWVYVVGILAIGLVAIGGYKKLENVAR